MSTSPVIDFHTHIFQAPFEPLANQRTYINDIRKRARLWVKPVTTSLHNLQTLTRYLPKVARMGLDQLSSLIPVAGLLIESTPEDLLEAMDEAGIDRAVVIAHPPNISNEFILDVCSLEPRLIPIVNVSKGTAKPGQTFKKYLSRGAKALKIHTAADGEGIESSRYKILLKVASEEGVPVILHTGCFQSNLFYKKPNNGCPELYKSWYETYPNTQFILAHMNMHDPEAALDVCEEFGNVFVDTSWQPTEVIGEAVRRLGADRVLFGTDWPLVGGNLAIGRRRIDDCIAMGLLNDDQAQLILGKNAAKLLGISKNAD